MGKRNFYTTRRGKEIKYKWGENIIYAPKTQHNEESYYFEDVHTFKY